MHPLATTIAATALLVGAGAGLLVAADRLIGRVASPPTSRAAVFLAPAMALLGVLVVLPSLQTLWLSLFDGASFVGFDNVRWLLDESAVRSAVRNTAVWVAVVAGGATGAGFVFAALAERLRAQRLVLTVVMVPGVISFVAVAVTWRLAYAFRPAGTAQVGVVNAAWGTSGLDPVAWMVQQPVNTVFLAMMLVWAQAGIAMLVLTSAISRVPQSVRDAARVDGADDRDVFTRITVPSIRGAIALAILTSAIVAIRVFDLVKVATDGRSGTAVLGTEMHDQAFVTGATGRGAILAMVMFGAVVPLALVLLRRVRSAEEQR